MRRPTEAGTVTAETALVLPLVTAFVLALVWLLSVGFAQIRVIDAARDAARAVSRGETVADAVSAASRTAPAGAEVSVTRTPTAAHVEVDARAEAPGWLLVPLPALTVRGSADVEVEDVD